jgi:integrase
VQAGIPIKVVSERLGHKSPSFTMKQYAHVLPTMQAEAASLITNNILGNKTIMLYTSSHVLSRV